MKRWILIAIDIAGISSLFIVCAGVYVVFGKGWTLIAAGSPPLALYVWHVLRILHARRRTP